jgi:hypothetical protein
MPILGIWASSFRSAAGPVGAYDALATVTVPSGGAASIDFVGIPNGYKHLQIRGIVKSTGGGTEDLRMQLNGVTSNYGVHGLYGTGSGTPTSNSGTSQAAIVQPYNVVVFNGATSIFGAAIFDILDYSNTNKYKTVRTFGGQDSNGSGLVGLFSGLFQDTSAVTSIKLFPTSNNFAQYSQFALYGVK